MRKGSRYEIVFDELALESMAQIEDKYDSVIRDAIETQLAFEPDIETRNRKPLKELDALAATWELRCGPNNRFRIFYDIDPDERVVTILLIAVKIRNQLWVGKERFEL